MKSAARGSGYDKTGRDFPLPVVVDCFIRAGSGRLAVDLFGETGNFAGSGFLMQHPFFGCFIDGGFGRVEFLDGILPFGEPHSFDDVSPGSEPLCSAYAGVHFARRVSVLIYGLPPSLAPFGNLLEKYKTSR